MSRESISGIGVHSLRQTQFFAQAPDDLLEKFAAAAVVEHVSAGQTICEKDAPGDSIYVIMEGRAHVHDGDLTLKTLSPEQTFGELSTFENSVCSADVTAETDMVLLRLDREPLFDIMSGTPAAGPIIAQSLCQCLRDRTAEVTDVAYQRKALERELQIGRDIQIGFLPKRLPEVAGWDIGVYFKAAREVAGDFYDVFTIEGDERIGLVIGDVCDKGVGAALFMTLFRSLLRAAAKSHEFTDVLEMQAGPDGNRSVSILKNSVQFANNYIAKTHGDTSMFATLFFGLLDPETGRLDYINAGHEEPVILRSQGGLDTLEPTGPAVGLFTGVDFGTGEARLDHGDTLFSYTDGVPDAANKKGEPFTTEHLLALLAQSRLEATDLVGEIAGKAQSHIGGVSQFDDITIVAATRRLPL